MARRPVLIEQLSAELALARGMSRDQRELVIDEAIDFMVTEYARPIHDAQTLERAFWATASYRVKRAREGRAATIRAGWRRVDLDGLEIAARERDPAAEADHRFDQHLLLEFAFTLTDRQRQVLALKYADWPHEYGRRVLARQLGLPMQEVRNAERAIVRKLNRFVALLSAGALCDHKQEAIANLAHGMADDHQEIAARLHLRHCLACRAGYIEQLRAVQSGETQHRIAQLLPFTIITEDRRARGGRWDALVDWITRPFTSESTSTAIQLASGARGVGALAAAKLATLCIGGAVVVGGGTYCVTTLLEDKPPALARKQAAKPAARDRDRPLAPNEIARLSARSPFVQVKPTKPTRPKRDRGHSPTQRDSGPAATRHERSAAVSPPIVQSSGAPVEEFGPGPVDTAPAAPAAPASSSVPEFP